MDNISSHKRHVITENINKCGAKLKYMPACSHDLNPIEKMWSKLKAILRKLKARTTKELDNAIATGLATVTPEDAIAWFTSCGYES